VLGLAAALRRLLICFLAPDAPIRSIAARAAAVDFHDRFTRPQTAIAQTFDRQEEIYRQADSALAGKFGQAEEGRGR
jgi:hypothetical protein